MERRKFQYSCCCCNAEGSLRKFAAGVCISIVWLRMAFRQVEFNFKRLLMGSFVASSIAALILSYALTQNASALAFAATFKNAPGVSNMLLMGNMRNFLGLVVIYFLGLTLHFLVLAKITVWLCRKR